jgi:hypothetical protein
MCPIPNSFRDRAISPYSSLNLAPNIVLPSRMWIGVKRQLAVVTVDSDTVGVLWKMPHVFINAEYADMLHAVLTRVAKCFDVDDGIFENVLYLVNYTNFVTWTINTGVRNSTYYLFLINSFGTVQWNNSISETVRNRSHIYIYIYIYNFYLEWYSSLAD